MKTKTRLNLAGAVVLLVGMVTATVLYQTCKDVPDNDLIYEMHHTPQYRRQLQILGGQMNVFADDFSLWFQGLWQGRSRASTVAALTVILASGFFFVAYHLPVEPSPDA